MSVTGIDYNNRFFSFVSLFMSESSSFVFSVGELQNLAADIINYARQRGSDACETELSEGSGQTVSVRCAEVDTIEYNRDKDIAVTVYIGQQQGHASTSDFSPAAVQATVDAALSIARLTAPDPFAGLPPQERLARHWQDPQRFFPWAITVEEAVALARQCEEAAFAFDSNITNSEGASVTTQSSQFLFANSLGFSGGFAASEHSIGCAVIAGHGDNMQREYWHDAATDAQTLAAATAIGTKAGQRALARLGARPIKTCDVPVLFDATIAGSLIGHFIGAVSGGALYRQSSFLPDSLGQQIFPQHVRIRECPLTKGQFGCTPFDDEGVATGDRDIVQDGILQGYFLSSYTARKLGMQTTANAGGPHRIEVNHQQQDQQTLIRQMHRGFLVTELLGQGVNHITGDYSRGAAGFWIEHGEIQHAVEEVTIAGNLRDMYRHIAAIGNDALPHSSRQCGSILLEQMTVAGQ